MTMVREVVNGICASILSGIIAPLSFTVLKPLIPNSWPVWLNYAIILISSFIILYLIWWFFDSRNKYKKYRESFKIGYWTGIFSVVFVSMYFYISEPIYRIVFLVLIAVIVIFIKLILEGMKEIIKE